MASENQAVISWAANTEADLAGYVVYAGLRSGVYIATSGIIQTITYTFATTASDGLWYFAVDAVDTSGNHSAKSAEVSKRLIYTSSAFIRRK